MFHQQEGFYAERLSDGAVRLVKHESAAPDSPVVMDHTIPAAEWVSIVAAVSASGGTSETYQAVRELHGA